MGGGLSRFRHDSSLRKINSNNMSKPLLLEGIKCDKFNPHSPVEDIDNIFEWRAVGGMNANYYMDKGYNVMSNFGKECVWMRGEKIKSFEKDE